MNIRDAEQLSSYLDNQMTVHEAARLESRLAADAGMRQALDDLRVARGLLRRTPRLRAPRNFTLKPTDARVRAPRPLIVPVLRYAGALASVLFMFSVATNTLAPVLSRSLASGPVGYGVGGGAPDQPPEAMAMPSEGTAAAEMPAAPQDSAAPTAEAFAKTAPPEPAAAAPARQVTAPPIPTLWLASFAVGAILAVGLSWYLDRLTRRNFRSRVLEK